MATAKNKKAATNKKSSAKVVAKKSASTKVVAKKAAVKKVAKAPAKKAVKTPVKPAAKQAKTSAVKKAVSKPAASKSSKVVEIKKAVKKGAVPAAKKVITPVKGKSPAKPVVKTADLKEKKSVKQLEKKVEVQSKKGNEKVDAKKVETSKVSKPVSKTEVAPISKTPQPPKAVVVKPEKAGKPSKEKKKGEDDEEGPDPLHLKADKVIKELEEIMDLSKMRPRIQAGSNPKSLPVRHIHPPVKLVEPTNTTKVKYQLEFEFRSSPKILFTSLSDSSGLAGWFADEVKTKDDLYTFIWEGGESYAKLVAIRDLQLVRFQWVDDTDGTYFQFEIKEDDITSDIALVITDFANPGEKDSSIKLWESQVQNLRMLLGSL